MYKNNGYPIEDLPELPHARQLKAGIPWLTFEPGLELEFLVSQLDENIRHIRVNLCLAIMLSLAFCAVDGLLLGSSVHRFPSVMLLAVVVPTLLLALASSFASRPARMYLPTAICSALAVDLAVLAVQVVASLGGVVMFAPLIMTTIFTYFMAGLMFYRSLAVNCFIMVIYLTVGTAMAFPVREFGYDSFSLIAVNVFCASIAYMHEKTSRLRFLEAGLLREMVSRDGLTGIHNRRMFDQHIARSWKQGVREAAHVAVMLVDIDCFKHYNDRYGHQAGDHCLRAVARALSQCAGGPQDFVARYGGEEFAVVLYDGTREYAAEVMTRIQRAIAQLGLAHETSPVANRLTVSIGAAYVLPGANRTPAGLVQLADEALYSAKEQGRNRVVVMEAEYQALRTGRFDKRRVGHSA
jgi:diguanylate cyclase (GGDEF)-like protein